MNSHVSIYFLTLFDLWCRLNAHTSVLEISRNNLAANKDELTAIANPNDL